jgi:hypothetical protein
VNQISLQDRQRINDITQILKSAHARAVALDLDLARDLPRDLAHARSRGLARDLAHDLPRDFALFRNLLRANALDLPRDFALFRNLLRANALDLALSLARSDALSLARDRDLVSARRHARELANALLKAVEKAERLRLANEERELGNPALRPVRAAGRVAGLAARVLPLAHRERYLDEYRSEVHDVAATGASWRQQVAYATRLLNRSWKLWYELRRPAARRARP